MENIGKYQGKSCPEKYWKRSEKDLSKGWLEKRPYRGQERTRYIKEVRPSAAPTNTRWGPRFARPPPCVYPFISCPFLTFFRKRFSDHLSGQISRLFPALFRTRFFPNFSLKLLTRVRPNQGLRFCQFMEKSIFGNF